MFRLTDLIGLIDSIAPFDLAESWDNVGLQIGSPQRRIRHILFALEVSPDVVKEAVSRKADTLVTHHPLVFRPLPHIDETIAVHHLVAEMIRQDLALVAAHTNLDASPHGTNYVIAEKLGVLDARPLFPVARGGASLDESPWGLGCVGMLKKPVKLAALGRKLKRTLHAPAIQYTGDPEREIQRVAICTGAATGIVRELSPKTVDVLVTGEINHHAAVDADTVGLPVLCAGHFETEAPAMEHLAGLISADEKVKKSGVKISISLSQTSPTKVI